MEKLVRKVANKWFRELRHMGYEDDTIYNKYSEFHKEAIEEIIPHIIYEVEELVLNEVNEKMEHSEIGNYIYEVVVKNIHVEVLAMVEAEIAKIEDMVCR